MSKPLDEPRSSANNYIVEKDQEWTRRWEDREHQFRKQIEEYRAEYDKRALEAKAFVAKFDRALHDQQAVILRIRDDIPFGLGKVLLKWAGYKE